MKRTFCIVLCACAGAAGAYETLPAWTLAWTNAACTLGHITTDAAHGGWTLHVQKDTSRHGGYGLTIALSHLGTGSGVVAGAGELDMRGTITGPATADGEATSAWKIGKIVQCAFCTNNGKGETTPARAITKLRSPGTITGDGLKDMFHTDNSPNGGPGEIAIIEPEATGTLPAWAFSGCNTLTNLLIQAPKLTAIGKDVCNCTSPKMPPYDLWDLSSVTTLGDSSDTLGPFRGWWGMSGTMNLPSLASVWTKSFYNNSLLGGVLLGTKGTLKNVGTGVFLGCNALTNVVLGASPSGSTLTLGTQAFAAPKLKRVWFNGDPPVFTKAEGVYTFGTSATAEGQITFYVRDTPAWADVLAEADADPDRLVSATVFDTAARQRVERFPGFFRASDVTCPKIFDANFTAKYDERILVSGGDFPYQDKGCYAYPAVFTATCSSAADAAGRTAAFYRWDGVPRALERTNPLTLGADVSAASVRAFFAHDWTYDASNAITNTIDNGVWKINVSVYNAAKRQLRVGLAKANSDLSTAITGTGSGALDFNGTIRGADGTTWQIVVFTSYAMTRRKKFSNYTAEELKELPTAVVYPETMLYGCGATYNFNSTSAWPLEEIVFIAPDYTGNLTGNINGAMKLVRATVRAPKVTQITALIYQDVWNWAADLDTWDLSGVTTIDKGAFHGKSGVPFKGTLELPNIRTIGADNFSNFTALAGAKLGTNLTLSTVGHGSFYNAKALKTLVLGNAKTGVTLGANAFAGTTAPTNVTFLGPRNEALADAVLQGVAASDGAKAATLYASPAFGWWMSAAAPTEAEEALMPADTLGVYRAGARKAWLVRRASPYDPRSLTILLR